MLLAVIQPQVKCCTAVFLGDYFVYFSMRIVSIMQTSLQYKVHCSSHCCGCATVLLNRITEQENGGCQYCSWCHLATVVCTAAATAGGKKSPQYANQPQFNAIQILLHFNIKICMKLNRNTFNMSTEFYHL